MKHQKASRWAILAGLLLVLVVGCTGTIVVPAPPQSAAPPSVAATVATVVPPTAPPADQSDVEGLSDAEIATLNSLERVDDYPLYTMRYHGAFAATMSPAGVAEAVARAWHAPPPAWACSLFATLADTDNMLFGRNFDWQYSPAVLLFTDPPDAYASVSMVDIGYLVGPTKARALTDLPLTERRNLLYAPFMPFDGLNEHGLVVGMAAVPSQTMPYDWNKETVDSLVVIREVLDHAQDVDEAVAIFQKYNVAWGGGPPLHYLIADTTGQSVLIEFYAGEMVVMPNESAWHLATNFLRAEAGDTPQGRCDRYDAINQRLTAAEGRLDTTAALDLLGQVAQPSTQWSVVYEMVTGDVNVVMGRHYDNVHTFGLAMEAQ